MTYKVIGVDVLPPPEAFVSLFQLIRRLQLVRRDIGLLQHALQPHELGVEPGVVGQTLGHEGMELVAQHTDAAKAFLGGERIDGELAEVHQLFRHVGLLRQG
ncbi:hypothetical protein D3C77_604010 [compost metagenome]